MKIQLMIRSRAEMECVAIVKGVVQDISEGDVCVWCGFRCKHVIDWTSRYIVDAIPKQSPSFLHLFQCVRKILLSFDKYTQIG